MAARPEIVVHISVKDDLDRDLREVRQQIDAVAFSIEHERTEHKAQLAELQRQGIWLLVVGLAIGAWVGVVIGVAVGLVLGQPASRWLP